MRIADPKHAAAKAAYRARKAAQAEALAKAAQLREQQIQQALRRGAPGLTAAALTRFFSAPITPNNDPLWDRFGFGGFNEGFNLWGNQKDQRESFMLEVFDEAPKVFDEPGIITKLWKIYSCLHVRGVAEWKSAGKSRDTVLKSLIQHLLVKYPVPQFMYLIFSNIRNTTDDLLLFCHLAQGGSVVEAVRMELIPVKLPRRACHLFTQAPADCSIMDAVRFAQVRFYGGQRELFGAVRGSFLRDFRSNEDFWDTVIQWLCLIPMLDPAQVGPLLDYLEFRKRQDGILVEGKKMPVFLMKGRAAGAVLREMEVWHTGLSRLKKIEKHVYAPSGFAGGTYEEGGEENRQTWTIREILSAKDLATEGRLLQHCVYSYSWTIQKGGTSIWSMQRHTRKTGHMKFLTIQVNNQTRAIVQARGIFNRPPTVQELNYLQRWATDNRLTLSVGRH